MTRNHFQTCFFRVLVDGPLDNHPPELGYRLRRGFNVDDIAAIKSIAMVTHRMKGVDRSPLSLLHASQYCFAAIEHMASWSSGTFWNVSCLTHWVSRFSLTGSLSGNTSDDSAHDPSVQMW